MVTAYLNFVRGQSTITEEPLPGSDRHYFHPTDNFARIDIRNLSGANTPGIDSVAIEMEPGAWRPPWASRATTQASCPMEGTSAHPIRMDGRGVVEWP